MRRYRIPKVSGSQRRKNAEIAKIKNSLQKVCVICGNYGNDLCHLLNKGRYPEHYTEPLNLVIMCRRCHNYYDNDIEFRRRQRKLFKRVFSFDQKAAIRYFKMMD